MTEKCGDGAPYLLLHGETAPATTQEIEVTEVLPSEHVMDPGSVDADTLINARMCFGLDVPGSVVRNTSWQARDTRTSAIRPCSIEWDQRIGTCPQGKTSRTGTMRQDSDTPHVMQAHYDTHHPADLYCRPAGPLCVPRCATAGADAPFMFVPRSGLTGMGRTDHRAPGELASRATRSGETCDERGWSHGSVGRGVWAEVTTLVLGAARESRAGDVQVQDCSSCSRLTDVPGCEEATMLHLHRRGLEQASEVAAVMDGAEWLQEVVASHRADAVRMLDVAHAAEEVSALGEAVHQAGDALPGWWLEAVLHRLTHEGPERILRQVSRLGRRCNDPDVGKKLQEVFQRRSQIQSPTSQAAGWPIGLSIVERANTLVVVARFTGAGRQWKRENVKCDLQ